MAADYGAFPHEDRREAPHEDGREAPPVVPGVSRTTAASYLTVGGLVVIGLACVGVSNPSTTPAKEPNGIRPTTATLRYPMSTVPNTTNNRNPKSYLGIQPRLKY